MLPLNAAPGRPIAHVHTTHAVLGASVPAQPSICGAFYAPAVFAGNRRGRSQRRGSESGACVHTATTDVRSLLERAYATRRALRLQAHRALSISSYAPKFDQQSFDPSRATDPDTERAQAAKLRAMLKKERKGAIRELRKDAQFLAEERDQRRVAEDTAYKKKMDKIVGGIQEERSEQKQLDRAKALIKKRAGKK